jgi:Mn2+/Fe2+ NRAMP family transporter
MINTRHPKLLATLGPGLLLAATGVGAGDLATAGFAGSKLGMAVLWAVVVGAFLKFVLNEGLTRWQLTTGQTLLEGAVLRLGAPVKWIFLPYFLVWSFFVSAALMSACGMATDALLPNIFNNPSRGKMVFGIVLSLAGIVLVRKGGFKLFEKMMSVCIVVMFITVIATAIMLRPDLSQFFEGLLLPRIPDPEGNGDGLNWTVALMGGVGGTVTVLCYGYWIREKGRDSIDDLKTCRIDLAVGYAATALFGLAMIVIASSIEVEGKGAKLIIQLANALEKPLGPAFRWAFLVGAWGALFSSLLGVWQAVPYIFADYVRICRRQRHGNEAAPAQVDTNSFAYRVFLFAIAIVPMIVLVMSDNFAWRQKAYAIMGAWFMPLLATVLLIMNGKSAWVGDQHRNRFWTVVILLSTLGFFVWIAWGKIA